MCRFDDMRSNVVECEKLLKSYQVMGVDIRCYLYQEAYKAYLTAYNDFKVYLMDVRNIDDLFGEGEAVKG